jgi:hypothetical protein
MARKSQEARRRQVAKAQAAPPSLAARGYRGGERFRDRFRALSLQEQYEIIKKMVIARMRAQAKRRGMPPPIFHTCEVRPCEGGGYELVEGSMRRMTQAENRRALSGIESSPD